MFLGRGLHFVMSVIKILRNKVLRIQGWLFFRLYKEDVWINGSANQAFEYFSVSGIQRSTSAAACSG